MDLFVPMNGTLYVVDLTQNELALANNLENPADNFATTSRLAYERVVRRLVNLPQQPAVIVLHYYSYFKAERTFYNSAGVSPSSTSARRQYV